MITVLITLTTAGSGTGPFDLYSNVDGYVTAFESGVAKSSLISGYTSVLVPNSTTTIRVVSTGSCTNQIDIVVGVAPTTSTTTTTTTAVIPTTTTTTSTTTTTTTAHIPTVTNFNMQQFDDGFGTYWASAFITLDAPLTQNVNFEVDFTFNGTTYTSVIVPMNIGQTTIVGGYDVTGGQPAGGLVAPICITNCVVQITFVTANVNISTFHC